MFLRFAGYTVCRKQKGGFRTGNRGKRTNLEKTIEKIAAVLLAGTVCLTAAGCGTLRPASDGIESADLTETSPEPETQRSFAEIIADYEARTGSDSVQEDEEQQAEAERQEEKTDAEDRPVPSAENAAVSSSVSGEYRAVTASYTMYENGLLADGDLFTERDLTQNADLSNAVRLTLADGQTVDVEAEGVYVLSGSASDCTVRIDVDKSDKVQLVLDGVSIENDDFPAIYILEADKVFVTTAEGSENTLAVTGTFRSDAETGTNTDAVIFSKDDLVLNGLGSLTVLSAKGNGITSKDEIKITGGSWTVASALDSFEANDSVAVSGGTFSVTSDKDGVHSENEDDDSRGSVWIGGGTWTISAKSDAIQGTSFVQIDGGTLTLNASEGIEATYVQINGGTVGITASDDGINASRKSSAFSPTVEINGGELTVVMGPGDTDAIDANGSIYVNGGTIDITAQVSSFDYDYEAVYNGGTIIVNGQQLDEIPASMMPGGGGFGRGGFGGGPGGNPPDGGWGGRGRWG